MKRLLVFLLTVSFMLSLTACGIEIEDTNGPDDYSLETITDENIINMDLGASGSAASSDDASQVVKYSSKNFSGVEEICFVNRIMASEVVIDLSTIMVKQGNFRLVVVYNDEIVHDFDLEEMSQQFKLEDVEGNVSVRIAGESASYEFYLSIQ